MTQDPPNTLQDGPLRPLRVLEALAGLEQPASLDAVASATSLPKSKAYRALRSLQEAGFVDHIGRAGYILGSRSVALATLVGPRPALLRTARPVLRWLADIASEAATLHLRSGSHRVLLIGAEPRNQPLHGLIRTGERSPLTSGCSGTAILGHLPREEAEQVMNSRPRREIRPSAKQLEQIRRDGYALSFSDNHPGINGIGAPLLAPADHYPLGSVAIAGREDRLPEATLRRLSAPLKKACRQLAPALANMLGPNSSQRLTSLDVTIQHLLDN